MVSRHMFGDLGDLKNEVDEVFRCAEYIRPTGANYLALSTSRRFPNRILSMSDRKINISSYMQYV